MQLYNWSTSTHLLLKLRAAYHLVTCHSLIEFWYESTAIGSCTWWLVFADASITVSAPPQMILIRSAQPRSSHVIHGRSELLWESNAATWSTGGGGQVVIQVMGRSYKFGWSFTCSSATHLLLCGPILTGHRSVLVHGLGVGEGRQYYASFRCQHNNSILMTEYICCEITTYKSS